MKIPRRVSRNDFLHHHTYIAMDDAPFDGNEDELEEYLWHVRKGYGSQLRRPLPDAEYAEQFLPDQTVCLRGRIFVSSASTGSVCIETGGATSHRATWEGQWLVLRRHQLAELATVERLLYLTAIHSQELSRAAGAHPAVREELTRLSAELLHYRSTMASEDCGGPAEARLFFKMTRRSLQISELKQELYDQLQDVEFVLDAEHKEALKISRTQEQKWRVKKDGVRSRRREMEERPKRAFDVMFFSFSAIVFPFVLLATIFGSNQDDLPRYVSWLSLVIAASVLSGLLLVTFALVYYQSRRTLQQLREKQKQHLDAGKILFQDAQD